MGLTKKKNNNDRAFAGTITQPTNTKALQSQDWLDIGHWATYKQQWIYALPLKVDCSPHLAKKARDSPVVTLNCTLIIVGNLKFVALK